jgi:hypothetical protein
MKKAIKRIARENPTGTSIALLCLGGAAAIGLTWWLVERNASAATPALTAPAGTIPLQPGPMTINVAQGVTQTFTVPAGSQIQQAVDNNAAAGGAGVTIQPTQASWAATGASGSTGYLTITWLNSAGAQQTTTVNYTVS